MLNTAFKKQVLIGFIITLIVALISAITSCLSVLSTREIDTWESHTYQVITKIQELDLEITNSETSVRGFIVTGNPRILEPYYEHSVQIKPAILELQQLVKDNPQQSIDIDSLSYYTEMKMVTMERNLELFRDSGLKSPQLILNAEKGQILKSKIYSIITKMVNRERTLLKERSDEAVIRSTRTIAIVIISTLCILLMILYLLTLIRKTFDFQKRVEEQVKERNERLAQLSFDNEQKNQLILKLGEVNEIMLNKQELDILATNILNEVCNYTQAVVGTFYFQNSSDTLVYKAGFAHQPDKLITSYTYGDGLVGQVAKEQVMRIITDLPDDYIKVHSSLGTSNPKLLYVIPIVNNHITLAVLEIAYLKKPTADCQVFLESLSEGIAVGLNSAIAGVTLGEMYEKVQSQSEELESQQEELLATNEVLMQKSDQLQASEEELKIQQEELQQTNAELEEKAKQLEERNLSINLAREAISLKADELEVSSRYKSEFLANMSHELRTPLNSILILAKILKENKPVNLTDDQIKYAGVIHNAGTDLLNLINDILDLSKIESGRVDLVFESVKPKQFCRNMDFLFAEVASLKQIEFTSDIDINLPPEFLTDISRVEQILKNLLSNAFKFTPENGQVKLQFKKANGAQVFYSENLKKNTADVIAISVIDSGIGIPKDKQRLIFEAFQQADGSTSRKYGGTGLGLSISKTLAALLGGEIQVSSNPDHGSNFTLFLPIMRNHGFKLPEVPSVNSVLDKVEHTLLIVEDDLIFANMLEKYAIDKGYLPILAHDGKTALELANTLIPYAIILDVQLPDMDGWSVLKKLKAESRTTKIPVHMMSSIEKNQQLALDEGAIGLLKKPVGRSQLSEAFELINQAQENQVKTVLVIEDQQLQSEAVKEQLIQHGIEVCQAFTAQQALDILEKQVFDCIILDLNLPDISGMELLDRIKTQPRLAHIPVVINTAMELDQTKMTQIMQYSEAMVLKSNKKNDRLMDEVNLFIHKLQHPQNSASAAQVKPLISIKPSSQEKVLHGKRILIADDDMRNIFALSAALHEFDMNILIATNGREALEKINTTAGIDLVLMDIMMPEMDGYEAMMQIRKHGTYAKIPIIALTAKAMKNDRQKCIEAGASDYITKPLEVDKLLSMMRVWLS